MKNLTYIFSGLELVKNLQHQFVFQKTNENNNSQTNGGFLSTFSMVQDILWY